MARKTTLTFIVELPLSVARADAREMGVRLELDNSTTPAWARGCAASSACANNAPGHRRVRCPG